jgi:uncharacterized protein YbjT (DUF2867 family)
VTLIEPGVVATELPNHITHTDTRQGVQQLYDKAEVTAEDVAEIIAFILSRPRRLAINEILLRPVGQTVTPDTESGDKRDTAASRRPEMPGQRHKASRAVGVTAPIAPVRGFSGPVRGPSPLPTDA